MWSQSFQNGSAFQEKKSEEKIGLESNLFRIQTPLFIFFLNVVRFFFSYVQGL